MAKEENKRKRRGAPTKDNPASARFEIRCTADQKRQWSEAAKKAGFGSLASWVKDLADKNS